MNKLKIVKTAAALFTAVVMLYILSRYNYLFFHSAAEGFAIIVAALIYVLSNRTYKYSGDNFLFFLGYAYLFIAIIDFFHMLTYYGMGVFPGYDKDAPTQLWISGRYMEAISLLLAPFFISRKFSRKAVLLIYSAATIILLSLIMVFKIFPHCYIEGQGLTGFKIASEYIICLITLGGVLLLYRSREKVNPFVYYSMQGSMAVTILSELSFTLYTDVYGVMNLLGHIFKIISFYIILKVIVVKGLEEPYDIIFEKLNYSLITDSLTGLYNRRGFMESFEKEKAKARMENKGFGLFMIDLDNFKNVNDIFGHLEGDRILKDFALLLKNAVRDTDVVCRVGGDEFVIIVTSPCEALTNIENRIRKAVKTWIKEDEVAARAQLDVSIGSACWEPHMDVDINILFNAADKIMYAEKNLKKLNRA